MAETHALTKNQKLVYEALNTAPGPLSAYTILDQLRDAGFRAPLQVYRALDKLLEMGLVHRLETINSFVACAHPHCGSHGHGMMAFAICDVCGQVDEFADGIVQARLGAWAADQAFQPKKTTIEMRGVCARCR
jgi:Fur family transcriptional regulator, zinc uptake regulator